MSAYKAYIKSSLSHDELACIYAALILADDNIPITAEKINTLLKAAGVNTESIWPEMFARCLDGVNVKEMITNIGSCSSSGSTTAVAAATTENLSETAGETAATAVQEDEDSDEDMGLSLFD